MQFEREFYDRLCQITKEFTSIILIYISFYQYHEDILKPRNLFLQENKFDNLYSFVIFEESNQHKISGESNNVARKIISNKIINAVLLPSKLIH